MWGAFPMPYQVGVTISAEVGADQVPPLRKWLADVARQGLAEPPFDFAHLRGVHFARFYLLEETEDLDGKPVPASLVFMSDMDAPLRRHLAELVDVTGDGIDQAFGHCADYPGPEVRRRARIAWLRRHQLPASAGAYFFLPGISALRYLAQLPGFVPSGPRTG